MKAKKLLVHIVIIAVLVAAAAYAYINYVAAPTTSPSPTGEEVFIVPTFAEDGTLEARIANHEPTLGEKLLGSILRKTSRPGVKIRSFSAEEVVYLEDIPDHGFIAFTCPEGTNVPMRGLIPPGNYDSTERYWYWGPYYSPPEMTVSERYAAGQTPNQIFEEARFGGNAAAKAEASVLNLGRPIAQGGLYILEGEPASQIKIRCSRGCGDGIIDDDLAEDCDDGAETAICDADCTDVSCGDGTVNTTAGETCDDGANNDQPNQCNLTCNGTTPSNCGNGEVENGEECDDGTTCEDGEWCGDGLPACATGTCEVRSGDGCSTSCEIDGNFMCNGTAIGERTSCGFGVPSP